MHNKGEDNMGREKKVDEIIEVISEIILKYLSENAEEKITIKR